MQHGREGNPQQWFGFDPGRLMVEHVDCDLAIPTPGKPMHIYSLHSLFVSVSGKGKMDVENPIARLGRRSRTRRRLKDPARANRIGRVCCFARLAGVSLAACPASFQVIPHSSAPPATIGISVASSTHYPTQVDAAGVGKSGYC